jgi:hypothetical protein
MKPAIQWTNAERPCNNGMRSKVTNERRLGDDPHLRGDVALESI